MLYFSTISVVEVGDPSSKKHSECSAMSLPTPPLLDPAPRTLPSTPRPAAVVQPDIGDGMRPLAEAPQKDNRIGWHYCPMWHCAFRSEKKSDLKQHMADRHDVDVQIFSCSMCDFRTKQKSDLKRHIAKVHFRTWRSLLCRQRLQHIPIHASDDAPQPAQPQPAQLQRERGGGENIESI